MGEEASLLDDLSAAWDEADAEIQQPEDSGHEDTELVSEQGPEGDHEQPAEPELVSGTEEPTQPEADSDSEDPAPVSWSAVAREQWKNIPKEAREYIHQREQQMQDGMRKNAEGAKRAQMMDQTLAPFQQLFAMNGGAQQFMPNLLQTASLLQMGSPMQKAQMVKALIGQFGVDIGTLDSLLAGENVPQQAQQQSQLDQMLSQKLAPIQQFMGQFQQHQQHQQQAQQQEINNELTQFQQNPKNEFYNDVRMDMADLLDMSAKRGQQMSLQEAYDRACAMNPQISQILQARQSQATVAQKRQAASSIHGTPGGEGDNSPPDSIRAALEEAWDGSGRM